ncbi:hypothetical protein GE09DRAFT_1111591 [Coniochaeta sp. 2T2.1]|nr:hypothetical protein GE09DRAFT_1111591 [Coniochaeta sp. 2T2.1]
MSCTTCLNSSRSALRRVFFPPLEPSSSQLRYLLPSTLNQAATHSNRRFFNGIKRISTSDFGTPSPPSRPPPINPRDPILHPPLQPPTHDSRRVIAHKPKGGSAPNTNLPRDEAIASVSDTVVLRREDGHLTEPRPLSSVLTEASIRSQTVVTIVLPRPGQKGGSKHPICVVLDRAAYEESERLRLAQETEKSQSEKKAKRGTKELEINWAIDPHDLEHKLRRFKEFLGKGLRVEMLLLKRGKKKGRVFKQASREEVEDVLARVRAAVEEVQGAREVKTPVGVVGERLQLFFEGAQQ